MGENVVLDAPASSELVVTADKQGYRGASYAVTTGDLDLDSTGGNPDSGTMVLWREGNTPANIDPAIGPPSKDLGDVVVSTIAWFFTDAGVLGGMRFAGGYRVGLERLSTLEAGTPEGPFYSYGLKFREGATATISGSAVGGPPTTLPLTSFVNVPEGEYLVTTTPQLCSAWTDAIHGYVADSPNATRVPVLAGHSASIVQNCALLDVTAPQ
jgi:hypothetical protein